MSDVQQAPGFSNESLKAGRIVVGGVVSAVGSEEARGAARLAFSIILASALSGSGSRLESITTPELRDALGPKRHDRLLDDLEQLGDLDAESIVAVDSAIGSRARFLAVARVEADTVVRREKESIVSETEPGTQFWNETKHTEKRTERRLHMAFRVYDLRSRSVVWSGRVECNDRRTMGRSEDQPFAESLIGAAMTDEKGFRYEAELSSLVRSASAEFARGLAGRKRRGRRMSAGSRFLGEAGYRRPGRALESLTPMATLRATVAIGVLLIAGCAGLLPGYKMSGNPAGTGLVVLECDVRLYDPGFFESLVRSMSESDISGGDPMPVSGARLNVLVQNTMIEKDPEVGLVMFDNLAPGRYRVERVTADPGLFLPKDEYGRPLEHKHYLYPVGARAPEELTFEIVPGTLRYLGKIVVLEQDRPKMRQGEHFPEQWQAGRHEFVLVLHEDAELTVWKRVLLRYSESSWTEAIRARVRELEARPRGGPRLLRWEPG